MMILAPLVDPMRIRRFILIISDDGIKPDPPDTRIQATMQPRTTAILLMLQRSFARLPISTIDTVAGKARPRKIRVVPQWHCSTACSRPAPMKPLKRNAGRRKNHNPLRRVCGAASLCQTDRRLHSNQSGAIVSNSGRGFRTRLPHQTKAATAHKLLKRVRFQDVFQRCRRFRSRLIRHRLGACDAGPSSP